MSDDETLREGAGGAGLGGTDKEVGQMVWEGRFQLLGVLGQGGGGWVWRAYDEVLDVEVALKFLPRQVHNDPRTLASLRAEVLNSRRLAHPNIVTIFNLERHGGEDPFISMELVRGRNLSQVLSEQPGQFLPWEAVVPLIEQLGAALAYAHQERVVHRDLKPSNLMVTEEGLLKLADFGISRLMSETETRLRVRQQASGTLLYMSPQQLEGKGARPSDDLYSLGATLYELLSGTPPFYRGEVLHQILTVEAQPLQQRLSERGICSAVPVAARTTILRCLAKSAEDRPQSVEELMEAMELKLSPPGVRSRIALPAGLVRGPGLPATTRREAEVVPVVVPASPAWKEEPEPTGEGALAEEATSAGRGWRGWRAVVAVVALVAVLGVIGTALVLMNRSPLGEEPEGPPPGVAPPPGGEVGREVEAQPETTGPERKEGAGAQSSTVTKEVAPKAGRLAVTARGQDLRVELRAKASGSRMQFMAREPLELPPGHYALRATAPAWRVPFEMEDVEVVEGRPRVVELATVRVLSEPPGAEVWDGERLVGTTPVEFPVSKGHVCRLRLGLPGYYEEEPREREIDDDKTVGPITLVRANHPTVGVYINGLGMPFFPVGAEVWMCAHETAVGHYRTFMGEWPDFRRRYLELSGLAEPAEGWARQVRTKPTERRSNEDPVGYVPWVDAVKFCLWLTLREREQKRLDPGWEYRLPSDAEWGKGAGLEEEPGATPYERARDPRLQEVFPWGTSIKPVFGTANYHGTNHDPYGSLAVVSALPTNRWGLHHMYGNLSEWCLDEFGAPPDAGARGGGRARVAVPERTVRGASFMTDRIDHMRVNYREGFAETNQSPNIGFRVVLTKVAGQKP